MKLSFLVSIVFNVHGILGESGKMQNREQKYVLIP